MGSYLGIESCHLYMLMELYDEIDYSIKNNTELDINKIIDQLYSFCLSDKFELVVCYEANSFLIFNDIVAIYEMKEKLLSLKIIFPLFEKLKNEKFEKILIESFRKLITNNTDYYEQFCNNNKEEINNFEESEKCKEALIKINSFLSSERNYLNNLWDVYGMIFINIFGDLLKEFKEFDDVGLNLYYIYSSFKNKYEEKFINLIINNLLEIKSLNYTKYIHQLIIFVFNLLKIDQKMDINEDFFQDLENKTNNYNLLNNTNVSIIYRENENFSESDKEVCEGKMYERDNYYINIFNYLNKIKPYKEIDGINGALFKNIFSNDNIILLIGLDTEYLEDNQISLENILNYIKAFKINTYVQIKNKIINIDNSYSTFIKELYAQKIIEPEPESNLNIIESKKIINTEFKDYNNKNEIDILKEQIISEINNNKELTEKIIQLEKELKEEKDKNKLLEIKIIELKKDLDNEIKKFNDFKKELDEKSLFQKKLENETKEVLNSIIEKDNKIKELKIKLSRFPFMLEEGEKLMSIIFTSGDQNFHTSIICKNTDKFNKIEDLLYEKYPKYTETENYFIFNGNKINRNKTLEQNNIKDNAIIILNTFEGQE